MKNTWKIDNSLCGFINGKSDYEGKEIELLTLDQLKSLKENDPEFVLLDIFGKEEKVKNANEDTRAGYVAFGVLSN